MKFVISGMVFLSFVLMASPITSAGTEDAKDARGTIGLALGSGGAAGLAHISMLQVFDDLDVTPDRISGTSIGAVIGLLYAAGLKAEEIHDIFDEFGGSSLNVFTDLIRPGSELSLFELLKTDIRGGALFNPDGFLNFLSTKIEAETFDDLAIPLEVVATDFWSGETVVLDQGDIFQAVKASIAVPGLFSPVAYDGKLLIDGGTTNPLPHGLLQKRCDLIVAIDVSGSRKQTDDNDAGLTDLIFKTFEIMQQALIESQMQTYQPDIYIKTTTSDVRLLEFNRIDTILEQSKPAQERLREQLLEFIQHPGLSRIFN